MTRPSPTTWLRVASGVSVLYCAGHTAGYPWTPGTTTDAQAVVAQLHGVSFDAMGVQRTYWDFYVGFGLIISAFLLAQAAWLWSLAAIARHDARIVVPGTAATLGAVVVNAYLSYRYFFAAPAVLAVVIGALLSAALFAARHGTNPALLSMGTPAT